MFHEKRLGGCACAGVLSTEYWGLGAGALEYCVLSAGKKTPAGASLGTRLPASMVERIDPERIVEPA
ncbi:hypothetical protein [Candidatus Laterigemmans baculatus]|uniref:hypothetical protein n=1 Tax=Candidatus Laterigemmans baculatus TaxID=2770505 RepID=UPI0013DB5626|nr:hypothetical protein [Candidatus Laterigemmans baculatus]